MSTARLSALFGLLVTLVAWAALAATHQNLRDPVAPQRAIADARHDRLVAHALEGLTGPIEAEAMPVDSQRERVTFTSGERILAEAAVLRSGEVTQVADYRGYKVPYGSSLAYQPWLLALLACVFVLCTAVTPLRRVRNLDVAAVLTLLAPMILLQLRFVQLSVIAAAPTLLYLLVRCTRIAFAGPGRVKMQRPLFDCLTAGWQAARRVRVLRMMLAALGLIFLMVCVSSTQPVDVLFALMEGATRIVHGMLPYGHMPGDVVHGDTYPLLSYLLYAPLARISPVFDNWYSVDLGLGLAAVAAIVVAVMLAGRSVLPRRSTGRAAPDTASLRSAVAWLSFPPLLAIASTGTSDVALAVMLLAVVLLWRRPRAAAAALAVATWFKVAPAVLVPPFLASLRGRRWLAGIAMMAAVSAALVAVLLALGGTGGVGAMLHAVGWQFQRGSPQSVWSAMGIGGLQPLGQAAVLGLVAATSLMIRRDPAFSEQPVRIAALVAAILIGLQLSADYWAFLYLAWVLPPLGASLLQDRGTAVAASKAAKSSLDARRAAVTTGQGRTLVAPVTPVPIGTST